uniref:Uncharacterized protein n=1 Tax=Schistocephalus solidus TaxID=70667 RepID=A0A0V0J7H6_SCHSO
MGYILILRRITQSMAHACTDVALVSITHLYMRSVKLKAAKECHRDLFLVPKRGISSPQRCLNIYMVYSMGKIDICTEQIFNDARGKSNLGCILTHSWQIILRWCYFR